MFGTDAITPTDFRSRFRRRLGLALVAAAAWLATSTACRADAYLLNGTTVLDGVSVKIGGAFSYDPGTNTTTSVNIFLVGPAPYAGNYLLDLTLPAANDVVGFDGLLAVRIFFSSYLPFAEAAFSRVIWAPDGAPVFPPNPSEVIDDSPTGAAVCFGVCAIAAPEPPSLALLGAALGLFLVCPRRQV